MSDMVERVGQAIKSAIESSDFFRTVVNGPNGDLQFKQFCEVLAMDAIEAMREPSIEMLSAAEDLKSVSKGVVIGATPYDAWQTMIDAALSTAPMGS